MQGLSFALSFNCFKHVRLSDLALANTQAQITSGAGSLMSVQELSPNKTDIILATKQLVGSMNWNIA